MIRSLVAMRLALGAAISALLVGVLMSARAQPDNAQSVPRLWTAEGLRGWPLPVAGINTTPGFHSEADYYAAPIDEVRTYPFYVKGREPEGYRDRIRREGPQPLIEPSKLRTESDWIAAGRDVFDGMHLASFRTADPRALAWADDPAVAERERLTVAADGTVPGIRWLVDHDGRLKLTLAECSGCHSRVLPDGSIARGAQTNVTRGSFPQFCFDEDTRIDRALGLDRPANEVAYSAYAVPWRRDDIHVRLKTMTEAEIGRIDGAPFTGTFTRVGASPWFTTKIADLIGVRDRRYLDATATHRNRGPEDIARYAILVTVAEPTTFGRHRLRPNHRIRWRSSDEAMLALGRYIYSLQPPANPHRPNELTARGEAVFAREGCASCHAPPLYTNNKLVPVEGFVAFNHAAAPPAADVVRRDVGLDPGLALRTRKGTGYYKVPTLRGVWYRGPLEHSGSIATLEDWFDPKRVSPDYVPTGWSPAGVKTRAIPGHRFGLQLPAEEKRALIAFLRTL